MTRRGLVVLLLVGVLWEPAAAVGAPSIRERVVRYQDADGRTHVGTLTLPGSYGAGRNPPLPLVLVPERGGKGRIWGDLPARAPFALLRLQGGPARVGPEGIAALADAPDAVRRAFPWLRLSPGRIYVFGSGEGGRRALRLAVLRPRLLAGIAALDVHGAEAFLPSGRQLAFSQVAIQLWSSSATQRQRAAALARGIRSNQSGGRVLAADGGWPARLEPALLGFGLLSLTDRLPAPALRTPASSSRCQRPTALAYRWPIRPFDRPHPVRGHVGDPRTRFALSSPDDESATGAFAFHNGADISAPGGTPVYPVVSGVAERAGRYGVVVRAVGGRSFDYQHIEPAIVDGARVDAGQSILGRVLTRSQHVHLTEFAPDGTVLNPLLHLTPFDDATAPVVASAETPGSARGRIDVLAAAYDIPTRSAGGVWAGLPVAPARIFLSLRSRSGKTLRSSRGVDFTTGLPGNDAFRSVYASGTRQNFAVIGFHYFAGAPGSYRYRLSLNVRSVASGQYTLVVNAADTCGNTGILSRPIRVLRDPSWRPPARPRPRSRRPLPAAPMSWHGSGYTVVLGSLRGQSGQALARALAERARAAGIERVGVLRSSRYRGLAPGYHVVFSGAYRSAAAAAAASTRIGRHFPAAYPRLVGRQRRG
ncbi:MAG: M23 family metallopeptidase [Gaiellaceae bacterium MAG52_C11]|nr:M23 family metallopeptidase [Candidatus Gaiellasilicea maunaloa]